MTWILEIVPAGAAGGSGSERLGEIYAVVCAMTWASAVVLFKRSGERIPPLPLNVFKTTIAVVLLAASLFVIGHDLFPPLPFSDYMVLVASGIIGVTLSDTLFFHGLNRLGAGRSSIVECLYSPCVIFLSFAFLGESLGAADWIGLGLILGALFTMASPQSGDSMSRRDLWIGIAYGAGAMITVAIGVVMMKRPAEGGSVFWVSWIRTGAALLVLLVLAAAHPKDRRETIRCFTPSRVWAWSVPGSILGTYLALVFWTAGFKYAEASRAAILNQSNSIFVLILAAIFLHEPVTRRKLAAITLGLSGVVLVTLG